MAAFIDNVWRKLTSLQPIDPKSHLSAINASIVKAGMQKIVIRMFAKLRLRKEKFVELRRSLLLRIIATNKMQFPTIEAMKITPKKITIATLSPIVNRHFALKQPVVFVVAFMTVAVASLVKDM